MKKNKYQILKEFVDNKKFEVIKNKDLFFQESKEDIEHQIKKGRILRIIQ